MDMIKRPDKAVTFGSGRTNPVGTGGNAGITPGNLMINGRWQEDAISWDFAQGGYPNPRTKGKIQEGGASKPGAGPEDKNSHGDNGAG